MTDSDDPAHRLRYRASGDDINVRGPDEVEDDEDVFEIRMPVASTGAVRNDGDDPLTRSELEGFARQIEERAIGVFPAHGGDDTISGGRYSPFERLGDWHSGEFHARSEDGEDGVLMATARMPDPETVPAATGEYRKALAILKTQAERGVAQDASIGWREDDDFPGGNDLMEVSVVGIGADWRTNTGDEQAEVVARAAVDAGADPDALVATVRDAVAPAADPDAADTERADAEATDDMTDTDDPGDDAGTTDAEQDANGDTDAESPEDEQAADDEEQERADAECPECGHGVRDGANYCAECGEELREDSDSDSDDSDDSDEEDDEEEGEEDDDRETEDADGDAPDAEQDAADADLEERIADLEAAVEGLRTGETEVDTPDATPEEEQDADGDAESADAETDTDRDTAPESPTDGLGDYR